jgi:dihydropteroate synthase
MSADSYINSRRFSGRGEFAWGKRTYVMGIINVSPESFSGDAVTDVEAAVAQGIRMVEEGADILDVGGESTRPAVSARVEARVSSAIPGKGATALPVEVEVHRVIPVIRRLAQEVAVPISVDTYKSQVARHAIEAGATIINDVWGLKADADLARVAAEHDVPIVLMHNQANTEYEDLMVDITTSLKTSIDLAVDAGVGHRRIILDPGFGFGKLPVHNLELLRRLAELKPLGYPILMGTSRKSTIGQVLGLPLNERLEGTAATIAIAISNGADIMRVHDVKAMVRVARMTDAIVRGGPSKPTDI